MARCAEQPMQQAIAAGNEAAIYESLEQEFEYCGCTGGHQILRPKDRHVRAALTYLHEEAAQLHRKLQTLRSRWDDASGSLAPVVQRVIRSSGP